MNQRTQKLLNMNKAMVSGVVVVGLCSQKHRRNRDCLNRIMWRSLWHKVSEIHVSESETSIYKDRALQENLWKNLEKRRKPTGSKINEWGFRGKLFDELTVNRYFTKMQYIKKIGNTTGRNGVAKIVDLFGHSIIENNLNIKERI